MTWKADELTFLLTRDVDDVGERARALQGKDRTSALREALGILERTTEPLTRLKALVFVQMSLTTVEDRKLTPSIAEPAALELTRIISSARSKRAETCCAR